MSERVDKFCDGLRDRLNVIEKRVESVKANVEALPKKAHKAVEEKANQARANLQAQKERMEKTRADLKVWADQKKAETQSTIRDWKVKQETKKLNARADRAEEYAGASVAFALATIDEAEEAILEAVTARMDADGAH